ncbi:MAG: 2-oxo acid dehydrogenase subunit E2 [Flavobacteriales bacterium]|nr:2-oxo acid dehydrogenase subunit E2 [Flavobacteriales bacterium]MCW8914017.1 2-oxo acid dehydrogenase subunit E2 [Flavobacteriales bacterium]MCW8938075.1 2-oxo acid dehydrogenase subunit E2 [Flavobacteriales bacterium]MCW8940253.1 2-oxo acid dehydrogenase subunit E2 [Flavobacteriales bacterium]MCW8969407.1 2-oxo acid dehydrogenase subunit E2 [Flavobacteriales bacterium]
MAQVELIMPKMGESVAEATITNWLKEEGDTIELDEAVVEIATDKVDSEVPSTTEGVLIKKLFNEGDVVQVGQAIAIIGSEVEAATPTPAAAPETKTAEPVVVNPVASAPVSSTTEKIRKTSDSGRFYSPLVRSIAETEGIALNELEQIEGTGNGGRVTKTDILNYIPNRGQQTATAVKAEPAKATNGAETPKQTPPTTSSTPAPAKKPVMLMEGDEIVEMDRMRKIIAHHMVESKHTSPHVTSYVEADVTNIVMWRNKVKNEFEKKENEKITFTPIFIEAIVKAIKDFPDINISVDGENIIKRKHINIGMAAALPSGNLIVPVIKDADRYNLVGLTKAVNDLANRARNNQLKPDEISGGTYTLTNVGSFGNVMGTPIISQPQVAIMAVGAIQKKPAVIETPNGDAIAIRHKMFLSHAYDHRVVDGALGGRFVRRVADYLEQFDINRNLY